MSTNVTTPEKCTAPNRPADDRAGRVTGPHPGFDADGALDHWYYRCERCGLESTDECMQRDGCFRCEG